MFCTEALEVYEAVDRAHVVVDGRLSQAIVVGDYAHIEALATLIARMQRHGGEPVHAPDLALRSRLEVAQAPNIFSGA
jgi:hypothetical protein